MLSKEAPIDVFALMTKNMSLSIAKTLRFIAPKISVPQK